MLDRLIERRDQLKQDYEKATQLIKEKEGEIARLRETLQRIAGAIEVLGEEIERLSSARDDA